MASSSSEAQIKSEIARLTASINQHKAQQQSSYGPPKSNIYINPTYRPSNKYVRPGSTASSQQQSGPSTSTSTTAPSIGVKEVVLNGVAFESSRRSLVRKDVAKPPSNNAGSVLPPSSTYRRKHGHPTAQRMYKPKSLRSRNMTLTNNRRPYQARRNANKSRKYSNKPCPRFTTTGACNRGLTCMYQHDPSKIAICWNFLQGSCPNTAETCNLSHEPTPERTPLCLHFSNKGRCTREKCPFPHVNVGMRHGICRDFAVLGYCEKGLDCDKKHVRECPDFAENGACTTKGCKLPHVIRANRNRKAASLSQTSTVQAAEAPETDSSSLQPRLTAEDAQLGDEFISLTFNESSDEDSEDDDDEAEANTDEDESEIEESSDPNEDVHIDVEEI
ncbi:hypothetical protein M378DRAFT_157570 [Amanita muscaria Koide BX008]|uniref:C3H1-type domain-containing protein n=1 Tax=Amanita muscaria (strain Koide BX008) TaxID=946122 RepID=A0A0C2T0I7_AMAMK|nr:hypothetical protein M378DRAFT_157570 [Amanita muscaria Koide BX008]